jgi:hypothetical protein
MKKSVIILIAIIYISAIAIVSFFGMSAERFEEIVYVQDVNLTNEGLKPGNQSTGEYYTFISADSDGIYRYQLEVEVLPNNATDKTVDYTFEANPAVTVDENGLVTITERIKSVTIIIVANDGSTMQTSVTLMCK